MLDNQYQLFRDLDCRCVAGGSQASESREVVKLKRASIESEQFRNNPVVREVLAGRTSFVTVYDSYSHAFRGVRRFVPQPHDAQWNERLMQFAAIVPNVKHFTRRSLLALDNPVACIVYGLVAATGVALVWAHANREDGDGASLAETLLNDSTAYLFLFAAFTGFVFGSIAMLKYRTRDPHQIHAREAAAYMDLNYGYYRLADDRAWEQFIHLQGSGPAASKAADDRRGVAPASRRPSHEATT